MQGYNFEMIYEFMKLSEKNDQARKIVESVNNETSKQKRVLFR